jgi:hypothetical protein
MTALETENERLRAAEREAFQKYVDANEALIELKTAVEAVLNTFETDEAQGYRSRDRQYAISILRLALPRS